MKNNSDILYSKSQLKICSNIYEKNFKRVFVGELAEESIAKDERDLKHLMEKNSDNPISDKDKN